MWTLKKKNKNNSVDNLNIVIFNVPYLAIQNFTKTPVIIFPLFAMLINWITLKSHYNVHDRST